MRKRNRSNLKVIFIFGLIFFAIFYIIHSSDSYKKTENLTDYITEVISPTDEITVPDELRDNVNFWKDIFANKSSLSVVYFTPNQNINIKQLELNLDFSLNNDGLINVIMTSDDSEVAKFNVVDLIDKNNPESILYLKPIREKIDEIYDDLDKKLHDNKTLTEDEHIGYTRGRKEKFEKAWKISGQYIEKIRKIFREENVPEEIVYLAFTESAFNLNANSESNALGIFQMIPKTARTHGLIVNKNIDERRDPILEARAAAKYLRLLYEEFNHWLFAINAYHSGENNLRKALAWAQKYYPEKPNDFEGNLRDYQYVKVVQEFPKDKKFNNGKNFRYGSNSARYTTLFLAFLESKEIFENTVQKYEPINFTSIEVAYDNDYTEEKRVVIKSGDTLSDLSYYYGVSVDKIKEWNDMDDSLIRPDDVLNIFVENPPITMSDLVHGSELSDNESSLLFDYNFSYKNNDTDFESFLNKKIYTKTTLNIPLNTEKKIKNYLSKY